MSTETTLMDALLEFQRDAPQLTKDAVAKVATRTGREYTYSYIELASVVEQVTPRLCELGLLWIAWPSGTAEQPMLNYRLTHVPSDESLDGEMPLMLSQQDAQGHGSAITYARRYAMLCVLGLAPDDDDGAAASRPASRSNGRVSSGPAQQTVKAATAKQRGLINGKAAEQGLSSAELANIVLAATEAEARDWTDDEHASNWLKRAMDRLPAKHVDAVLAGIADS